MVMFCRKQIILDYREKIALAGDYEKKKRIDICKIRNRKIRGTAFIRKCDYGISWRAAYVPPV